MNHANIGERGPAAVLAIGVRLMLEKRRYRMASVPAMSFRPGGIWTISVHQPGRARPPLEETRERLADRAKAAGRKHVDHDAAHAAAVVKGMRDTERNSAAAGSRGGEQHRRGDLMARGPYPTGRFSPGTLAMAPPRAYMAIRSFAWGGVGSWARFPLASLLKESAHPRTGVAVDGDSGRMLLGGD
jgi:hypothetical protein